MSELPTIGHLINGQTVHSGSRSQPIYNPATGQVEKTLLLADAASIRDVILFPALRREV